MENQERENKFQHSEQDFSVEKTGSVLADRIYVASIIGQIEGHYILPSDQKTTKYEHIVPLLISVERSEDVDGLLLIINTMGGDVESGLAIAELISGMKKPTVSLVLGGGHSIGVPLAVCSDYSFIAPSATMTIHPVRVSGTVVGSPQTYFYFEKMQNRIIKFVCDHSKITPERFRSLMLETEQIATDTGSVIDGYQAVECGLIDRVGGLSDALLCLEELIKKSRPCSGDSCPI